MPNSEVKKILHVIDETGFMSLSDSFHNHYDYTHIFFSLVAS